MRSLAAFLRANDMPAEVEDVTTESIRAFLVREGRADHARLRPAALRASWFLAPCRAANSQNLTDFGVAADCRRAGVFITRFG